MEPNSLFSNWESWHKARNKAGIRLDRASTNKNGQVESANMVLLRGLNRRLEKAEGNWSEEISRILWSDHTTPQSTTKETLFSLGNGSDAMIPVEIQKSSLRFQGFVIENPTR